MLKEPWEVKIWEEEQLEKYYYKEEKMKATKITTIIERPDGETETTETLVPEGSEEFHYRLIQDEKHQAIMDKCNEILKAIKNMTVWEK